MENKFEGSAAKVENKLVQSQAYLQTIVKEQERFLELSSARITNINKELKAVQFRLKPYMTTNPKQLDENYYNLKETYKELLSRRAIFERTRVIAEESVTAAKLNMVPGQYDSKGDKLL